MWRELFISTIRNYTNHDIHIAILFLVTPNTFIKKGEQIATIGNCDGTYLAHLHLEIRNEIDVEIGAGYSVNITGYLSPTNFINKNRN
ncbi:M23 family metallopeptidase [Psychroserpens burtonensis]|uniref:M23 family metallopeptidase n=1 Tax=Psychroserpens burtonensis TaxID=49278 RepID=A0A5C7B889_9FLAO|nr:M23 family metallopeptidase [Psychroserpens burtonensis]